MSKEDFTQFVLAKLLILLRENRDEKDSNQSIM